MTAYAENAGQAKMPQAFTYEDAEEVFSDALHNTRRRVPRDGPVSLGANTTIRRADDNSIVIRLHQTDIICYYPDDSVSLNSGGYHTRTTMGRINAFLSPYIRVYSEKGRWHVDSRGSRYHFQDGMNIPSPGERGHHRGSTYDENPAPSRRDASGQIQFSDDDYGVFVWREDGRYVIADSVGNYMRESAAQRYADRLNEKHPNTYVVRQLKYLRRF